MAREINFGIGFITGRPNVCKIINTYAKYLVEQVKDMKIKVNFTIFILFDLGYQFTTRTDFYGILPEVYQYVNIKYITPEEIDEEKKIIMSEYNLTFNETELFIGKGYAKARNAIMYNAIKMKMDYLLFWDDDEYPLANVKNGKELQWIKQYNVLTHLKHIEDTEVTMGYRCGMMNPIPYIEYNDDITEEDYHSFIDGLENEVVDWDKIQTLRKNNTCLSYATSDIALAQKECQYFEDIGKKSFVLASGICLNLDHLNKIPAFYNPPEGRGEDTFFSCALGEKNARVLQVPTYHFHDSFLKYTGLMKGRFPKKLAEISLDDSSIEQRFLKTTIGWMKYKPLLYYITDRENYKNIIKETRMKLKNSVYKINTAFETCDFSCLISILDEYDKNVEKHYEEYLETNRIWDKIKNKIGE